MKQKTAKFQEVLLYLIAVTSLAFSALVIALSPVLQQYINADVILFSLISTQKWTFFYWGQDRLGSLLPLLAISVQNPFYNLIFQSYLAVALVFGGIFVIFGFFYTWKKSLILTLFTLLVLVSLFPVEFVFELTIWHYLYIISIGLSLLGLKFFAAQFQAEKLIKKKGLIIFGSGLLILAIWLNRSVIIFWFLFPLIIFSLKEFFSQRYKNSKSVLTWLKELIFACFISIKKNGKIILILITIFIVNFILLSFLHLPKSSMAIIPFSEWTSAFSKLIVNSRLYFNHNLSVLVMVLILWGVVQFYFFKNKRKKIELIPVFTLLIIAGAYFFVVSSLNWVKINLYYPRYIIPSAVFLIMASVLFGAFSLLSFSVERKKVYSYIVVSLSLLVMLISLFKYGYPSVKKLEDLFERKWGRLLKKFY